MKDQRTAPIILSLKNSFLSIFTIPATIGVKVLTTGKNLAIIMPMPHVFQKIMSLIKIFLFEKH
jgi:hypothetical protein